MSWSEDDLRARGYEIRDGQAVRIAGRALAALDTQAPAPKRQKWGNKKTIIGTNVFRSQHEADTYMLLRSREQAGEISDLRREVEYNLVVNGVHVCDYRADFVYRADGLEIVADAKGRSTREFAMKRKLMLAVYGIAVLELR